MQLTFSKTLLKEILVPITLIIIFGLLIWGVIKIQDSFQVKPNLEVRIPEISNTTEESINLTGKTLSKAAVTVNGKKVVVDKSGNFSYLFLLNPGENKIVFKAQNGASDPNTVEKIVIREQKPLTAVLGNSNSSGQAGTPLTSSGPNENIGILGLIGLVFSLGLYSKSRKIGKKDDLKYKLFT